MIIFLEVMLIFNLNLIILNHHILRLFAILLIIISFINHLQYLS